jgi:uncharacterized membrane protein YcaP (DUF421 family)
MEIVYRALFVFCFLWFITRVTGRTTLGELSTFQLLLYVTMGDLVQQAVTQQDYSVTSAVLAIGTFTLATALVAWLNARFRAVRPVTHGTPMVVIHDGEPVQDVMRAERLSYNDLLAAARTEGVDDLGEVRIAVLETNGRISFFSHQGAGGSAEPPEVG